MWQARAVSFQHLLWHPNTPCPAAVCPLAKRAAARYIGNMTPRGGYPSDLSDARWALIEPVLTAWRAERRGRGLEIGRPPDHDMRSLMNVVLYVDRTGIPWRYLPHDFPRKTVNRALAAVRTPAERGVA